MLEELVQALERAYELIYYEPAPEQDELEAALIKDMSALLDRYRSLVAPEGKLMAEMTPERIDLARRLLESNLPKEAIAAKDAAATLIEECLRLRAALAEMTTYRDTCQRQLDAVDAKLGWIGTGSGRIEAITTLEAKRDEARRERDEQAKDIAGWLVIKKQMTEELAAAIRERDAYRRSSGAVLD